MKLFNVDGPLHRMMSALTDIFILSMCWMIGSLPIITAGISTVALFDVTLRMVDHEEGYVARQFIKAYKSNVKQGFLLGFITVFCFYVMFLYSQILHLLADGSIVLMIVAIVTGYLFVCSLLYAYPLTARYKNSVPRILKNSARISMKYFWQTVLLVFVVVVELITFWWNLTTLFIGILIGPALIAYTISVVAKDLFLKIEKDNASGE